MKIIGLVGGIASGKSRVAHEFARLGARVLDADLTGHQVLEKPDIRDAIVARWGNDVLQPDGSIDRRAVGRIVFGPPPNGPVERAFLESLTHPEICRAFVAEEAALAASGVRVAILDAALLFEAGWDAMCDEIVFVDAPHMVRLERARSRGWSAEEFHRREAAQTDLAEKRAAADATIDNASNWQATQQQIAKLWKRWSK